MKRFLSLAILAVGTAAAQTPARVKVDGGWLQGTSEDGLTVYRGIPFAAPPVGELRWRAPQPAAKWEGVKPADKFGARCYQGGRGAPGVDTSEDCLYLNVWSPAKSASDHIPVLVWIYGGGFSAGAAMDSGPAAGAAAACAAMEADRRALRTMASLIGSHPTILAGINAAYLNRS